MSAKTAHNENLNFQDEFMQILHTMAIRMFEEFSADACANGFPAKVESGDNAQGNPFARVRFVLNRAVELDVNPADECEFIVTGLLGEEKIDILAVYDKRPGKEGSFRDLLEIQMINQLSLENTLTDFLAAAMASRKDQPIPPRTKDAVAAAAASPAASGLGATPIPIIWKARKK